jgi:hypothetical protein
MLTANPASAQISPGQAGNLSRTSNTWHSHPVLALELKLMNYPPYLPVLGLSTREQDAMDSRLRTLTHPSKPPLRAFLLALLLCLSAATTHAQSADITLDTKATPEQIQTWLRSSDPRLISWGAHFAREQDDRPALILIVELLARWTPPQGAQDAAGHAQISPATAMLDALIQRGVALPPETLTTLAPTFPTQASIFASRLPMADSTPLLLTWYSLRTGDDRTLLAKVAAMLLSHAPPTGFAASVLAEAEETLDVEVFSESGQGLGGGYGSGCGDTIGGSHPRDWPPIFTYALEEDAQRKSDFVVVEAAGDRIVYLRHELNGGWGSCSNPHKLDADGRHHLLAQMLDLKDNKMPWKTHTFLSIVWQSNEQFVREAQDGIASEEGKLHDAVKALAAKELLTPEEAASVRPKLSVQVEDHRKPPGEPLPQLRFADPRTVLAPPTQPFVF